MPEDNSADSDADVGPEGHSEVAPVPPRETEKKSCKCECRQTNYFSQKAKDLISLFTLIAIGIYTVITVLLWCNSRAQLVISRDTEIRQLRAYLILNGANVVVTPQNFYSVSAQFKNTGMTPAYKIRMWTAVSVKKDLVFSRPEDATIKSTGVIGPGGATTVGGDLPYPVATVNDAMKNQGRVIHFWGEAAFTDAFGCQRSVPFRLYLDADGINDKSGMKVAEEGNDPYEGDCLP